AQPPTGREAVESGQHHVEDDRVVGNGLRHPERCLAALRRVGCMAILTKAACDQRGHLWLVLDDEYSHRLIVASVDETAMSDRCGGSAQLPRGIPVHGGLFAPEPASQWFSIPCLITDSAGCARRSGAATSLCGCFGSSPPQVAPCAAPARDQSG